eukprot:1238369-Pyramimonas_sp.AAC.1
MPAVGDRNPGHLKYSGTMYPMQAHIATRPCLISVTRRLVKSAAEPSTQYPAGSQKPTGACTPSSFS